MGLQANLTLKLKDVPGLQASFTADLGNVTAALQAINIPVSSATLSGAVSVAGEIDLSNLEATAKRIGDRLVTVAGELPGVGGALTAVTDLLDLAKEFTAADIGAEITALIERLSKELDSREGAALGAFVRMAESLQGAPQSLLLLRLYELLVQAGGAPALSEIRVPDLLPALVAAARTLGILMALETLLEETERLSGIMASQLDVDALAAREAALVARFEALPNVISAVDVADAGAVELAARTIAHVYLDLAAYVRDVAEGMALGEATLAYIDFPRLLGEIQALLEELRAEDISAIERAAADLAGRITPLLQLDLSRAPRFALNDLLNQAEAKAAELAATIATADLSVITAPVTAGLAEVTRVPAELAARIDAVKLAVGAALQGAKRAIGEVPLDRVTDALQLAAGALADALAQLTAALGTIDTAVGTAATALQAALHDAEAAVDTFAGAIDALFRDAKTFVDGLHLDRVAGEITGNVNGFSAVIEQANLSPYFSTAVDAINTAAGVVENVPFALLPDSMEQDVVAVARPIKQTDLGAFRAEILTVLQISETGTFSLRPELESAVADIQQKIDSLLAAVRTHDPKHLADALGPPLDALRARIQAISPQIELAPVRAALDRAKAAVAGLDPTAALAPIEAAFDAALAKIDAFAPAAFLDPLDARINEARTKIIDTIRLRTWRGELDQLETRFKLLLAQLDMSGLEADLASALADLRRLVEDGESIRLFDGIGAFLAALLAGRGRPIAPVSFAAVADWLAGASPRTALEGHAARAFAHIEATKRAVEALDPQAIAARVTPKLATVRVAVELKAAGVGKARLEAALIAATPVPDLALIGANRSRYLAALNGAMGAAAGLRDLALGEADAAAARLRAALAPFASVADLARSVAEVVGMSGSLSRGLSGIILDLLEVAPPARLAAMLNPVYQATRGRLEKLLETILNPVRQAIDDLLAAIDAINLQALRADLAGIHAAVKADVESLRPSTLLAAPLATFVAARTAFQAFDPLGAVVDALEAIKASALAVTKKLDPKALVATPQAIFDEILSAVEKLRIGALLASLYQQLDAIAAQIDRGLEDTVTAFKRLQDALPDKVGSTSLTASASLSVH